LLFPLRSLIFSPRQLAERLSLRADARVLELGSGPGFFSVEIARRVACGHLCLIDLQHEMLTKARGRLRRAGITNASFAQASATALPLADDTFDVAYLVTVLGEVPDPASCIVELCRTIRPGGLLSITELAGDPDAMTESEVAAMASAAKLDRIQTFPMRFGFTINFKKPEAADSKDPEAQVDLPQS
jgi:uncharacterized protein